jgi:hypothetical protein
MYFYGGSGFWHHGMGVFLAAETKEGHLVQYFQAPMRSSNDKVAIIAAVAILIGDDVITFTPTGNSFATRQVMRIRVNGIEASYGVAKSLQDGYVTAAARTAFRTGASQPVCVGDHRQSFTVTMEADPNRYHEINWKIMMNDGAIDSARATCRLGPASYNTTSGINTDRVPMKEVLFSAQEMHDLCRAGWAGYGGVCNYNTNDGSLCPNSNKRLCDTMGHGYHTRALNACKGLDAKFKDFCVFQYCNDMGKGDSRRQAMLHEEEAEARQSEVMASHY